MEDKLPDYVLKQCIIYIKNHRIVIRLLNLGEKPYYAAYYSINSKFKYKDIDWIDNNFPFVHGGYSFEPGVLEGINSDLTFVGWDYGHYGDVTENYSIDLIKEEAILALEEYINMFEEGER